MESLPDELNCMIASYFDSATDSANYRLTSKYCARIGAQEHFRYFALGKGTPASALERMRNIVASPRQLVKNIRGLDFVEEYEQDDDEQHQSSRFDCRVLASVAKGLGDAGAKLEVLSVQWLRFEFFQVETDGGGGYTTETLAAFAQSCRHVKDLYISFDEVLRSPSVRDEKDLEAVETNIQRFLGKLDKLEVLTISFDEDDFVGHGRGHHLDKILPLNHRTWGNLRSLELHHFHVTGYDLITFLRNHRSTGKLRCVHWTYLSLKPIPGLEMAWTTSSSKEIWQQVFSEIGKSGIRHADVFWGSSWSEEGKRNTVEWVVGGEGEDGREVVVKTDLKMWLEGGEVGVERKESRGNEGGGDREV